jgi:hypothetical protein
MPLRRITLHRSQRGFTDAETFISSPSVPRERVLDHQQLLAKRKTARSPAGL